MVVYRQVSADDGFIITAYFTSKFDRKHDRMEKTVNPADSCKSLHTLSLFSWLFPPHIFAVDYDQEADVLYISFERPQKATDTEMTDDGLLLRYRHKQLVGLTVFDASTRATT